MFAPVINLIEKAFATPALKGPMWKYWYRYVNGAMGDRPIWFMNYGYKPADGPTIELKPEDEPNRTTLQLYEVVARPADLTGKEVLEVSCGRGGGARFVRGYRNPRMMVGLDRTERSVDFCTRQHGRDGLRFLCGNAMALPFHNESFDAVVNIEASHCYPDFQRFLNEIRRVLRPGGHFLYADTRMQSRVEPWQRNLDAWDMQMVEKEDITADVVRALECTNKRVASMIRDSVPRLARPFVAEFAATEGSAMHRYYKTREALYFRYAFRKQAAA